MGERGRGRTVGWYSREKTEAAAVHVVKTHILPQTEMWGEPEVMETFIHLFPNPTVSPNEKALSFMTNYIFYFIRTLNEPFEKKKIKDTFSAFLFVV